LKDLDTFGSRYRDEILLAAHATQKLNIKKRQRRNTTPTSASLAGA
jgi:hypothetical protein